jgi:hypothetical protein
MVPPWGKAPSDAREMYIRSPSSGPALKSTDERGEIATGNETVTFCTDCDFRETVLGAQPVTTTSALPLALADPSAVLRGLEWVRNRYTDDLARCGRSE